MSKLTLHLCNPDSDVVHVEDVDGDIYVTGATGRPERAVEPAELPAMSSAEARDLAGALLVVADSADRIPPVR